MVGAGEAAVAVRAAEGLDACVLAEVPGQLVGAGELPGAAFPGAFVGLLTCARGAERGQHCKNYCHVPCRGEKKTPKQKTGRVSWLQRGRHSHGKLSASLCQPSPTTALTQRGPLVPPAAQVLLLALRRHHARAASKIQDGILGCTHLPASTCSIAQSPPRDLLQRHPMEFITAPRARVGGGCPLPVAPSHGQRAALVAAPHRLHQGPAATAPHGRAWGPTGSRGASLQGCRARDGSTRSPPWQRNPRVLGGGREGGAPAGPPKGAFRNQTGEWGAGGSPGHGPGYQHPQRASTELKCHQGPKGGHPKTWQRVPAPLKSSLSPKGHPQP